MSYIGTNKIGKMYLGTTEIAKAYLGNNLVYQQGSQPQPVMIPYIRGGADGSYINTGINPDSTTKVIIWARNWNPAGGIICGARNGANVQNFFLAANRGTPDVMTIGYGGGATAMTGNQYRYFSSYHKYELNGNVLSIDDTVIGSAATATVSCSYPLHLLGLNSGGTHANTNFMIDICACQIYKNNVLVRDFTAVNSPSVGLYDAVSDTVFTNAGSGSFVYGTFNQNAYTRLEYIECAAAQGFDTGATIAYSDIMICRFMTTQSTPRVYYVFSAPTTRIVDGYKSACSVAISSASDLNRYCAFTFGRVASSGTISSVSIYNSTSPRLTNLLLTFVKWDNKGRLYLNDAAIGTEGTATSASSGIQTDDTCVLGGASLAFATETNFTGRFYYFGIGSKRSLVAAKVNNIAGMYDNYNDVFYPSATSTPFIAGPNI